MNPNSATTNVITSQVIHYLIQLSASNLKLNSIEFCSMLAPSLKCPITIPQLHYLA